MLSQSCFGYSSFGIHTVVVMDLSKSTNMFCSNGHKYDVHMDMNNLFNNPIRAKGCSPPQELEKAREAGYFSSRSYKSMDQIPDVHQFRSHLKDFEDLNYSTTIAFLDMLNFGQQ